jgi:hypothetical protein
MSFIQDIINKTIAANTEANTYAPGKSMLFRIYDVPANSKPIAVLKPWPSDLPTWVLTPDNRIVLSHIPLGRKSTDLDVAILMQSLQIIYNVYVINPPNVFTYVSPVGATFSGVINLYLLQKYGINVAAFDYTIPINNMLLLPDFLKNQTPDTSAAAQVGIAIKKIITLVPFLGTAAGIVFNAESQASAAAQARQLQAAANINALNNSIGNLSLLSEASDNAKKYIFFSIVAIVLLTIFLNVKK